MGKDPYISLLEHAKTMESPTTTQPLNTFWKNRRVFLTGHTGFKGGWLALWLAHLGRRCPRLRARPLHQPQPLHRRLQSATSIEDIRGDIRDAAPLERRHAATSHPEVVFHLAAQPLVRYSYEDPIGTYETNVIGTARVLDAVRRTPPSAPSSPSPPTSATKTKNGSGPTAKPIPSAATIPTPAPKPAPRSSPPPSASPTSPSTTLAEHGVAIATARAGNVIGGGDWSSDRLIPDLVRGFLSGEPVRIRRPHAIRPWQHVLEPLHGYIAPRRRAPHPGVSSRTIRHRL